MSCLEGKKTKKGYFWPKKGENEFSWTWCQYKKCSYWSKLTFYRVWAKSLEPFLIKWPKTLKKWLFLAKKVLIKKKKFFFRHIGLTKCVSLILL